MSDADESVERVRWWAEATMTWFVMTAAAVFTLLAGALVPVVLGAATVAALLLARREARHIGRTEDT